ncbi:unnamed protein product [Spirodela intermedia]|uniref:Uncharacterized protein n=1 Tax=Spirodela intermedia TaxID=51605 RepID=A0A7I8JPR6_SPIIN|nr:unnamed protein product [Spirodela intermedia]CAA6671553.1 unnamed protein product [Spirodela intermedia]
MSPTNEYLDLYILEHDFLIRRYHRTYYLIGNT